ncbi:MAG: hypothetical protein ACP5KV_00735 [Candidatus Methanomethylicaceae archaeon]
MNEVGITAVSSDGEVKVFDLSKLVTDTLRERESYNKDTVPIEES